jgi:hypothetical protein
MILVVFALSIVSKIVIADAIASPTISHIVLAVVVPIAAMIAMWISLRFFLLPFSDLLIIRDIMLRSKPIDNCNNKEKDINNTYSKPYPIGGEVDT